MIPLDDFKIITNPENEEKLIIPNYGTGNDSWKNKNLLWLRSLHIDKNDKVISCGFKKFFNINEGPIEFQITEQKILDKKDLVATLKIDGSLLIRYVQNGIVKWRTRGALQVGLDNKYEIDEFIKKYPKLNHASLYPDTSILFEWVSPKNQIVIKYDKPELYLVGAVSYLKNEKWYDNDFSLLTMRQLEEISKEFVIDCTQYFKLNNTNEVIKLIEKLKSEKEIEGYVLRFNNEQELVKIKSDHYFILHGIKSKLNTESLIDLFLSWDRPDFCIFQDKFEKAYDYETWVTAMPAICSMYDGIKVADAIINHIIKFVEDNKHLQRKEFALKSKQAYQNEKLSMCFSLLDNKPLKNNTVKTFILQNCKHFELSLFKKNLPQDELEE